jgi:hypothetical protein
LINLNARGSPDLRQCFRGGITPVREHFDDRGHYRQSGASNRAGFRQRIVITIAEACNTPVAGAAFAHAPDFPGQVMPKILSQIVSRVDLPTLEEFKALARIKSEVGISLYLPTSRPDENAQVDRNGIRQTICPARSDASERRDRSMNSLTSIATRPWTVRSGPPLRDKSFESRIRSLWKHQLERDVLIASPAVRA